MGEKRTLPIHSLLAKVELLGGWVNILEASRSFSFRFRRRLSDGRISTSSSPQLPSGLNGCCATVQPRNLTAERLCRTRPIVAAVCWPGACATAL